MVHLGPRHRQFVTKDLIAKHVLYLQATVAVPSDRFVVHDDDYAAYYRGLRNRFRKSDVTDEVGFWFYRVLSDKTLPGQAFYGANNTVLVSTAELVKVWEQHAVDKKPISVKKLSYFLDAFCTPGTKQYTVSSRGGVRVRLRELSLEAYEDWMTERGLDPDEITDGLQDIMLRRPVTAVKAPKGSTP